MIRDLGRPALLLVQGGHGPASRAVLEGQGQAGSRCLHLEQRAGTGDDRIGRRFLADRGEMGDREVVRRPSVTSRGRPLNQSVRTWTSTGSTRMNAMTVPFHRGPLAVVRGTRPTEHLFDDAVTVDRTGVRCQASSGGMSSTSVSPRLSRPRACPDRRRRSTGMPRARRSSGFRGSRSNGAGSPLPTSRPRVTARDP